MTKRDRTAFEQYLHQCTDRQVLGVLEKERNAGRSDFTGLAANEAARRNLI